MLLSRSIASTDFAVLYCISIIFLFRNFLHCVNKERLIMAPFPTMFFIYAKHLSGYILGVYTKSC
jgi:hypothetical protein